MKILTVNIVERTQGKAILNTEYTVMVDNGREYTFITNRGVVETVLVRGLDGKLRTSEFGNVKAHCKLWERVYKAIARDEVETSVKFIKIDKEIAIELLTSDNQSVVKDFIENTKDEQLKNDVIDVVDGLLMQEQENGQDKEMLSYFDWVLDCLIWDAYTPYKA